MTTLYTVIQNNEGQVFALSSDLDVIKREFCIHALQWLLSAVTQADTIYYDIEWVGKGPVLMRLSDRAVLCSTADVMPEALALYKDHLESLEGGLSDAHYEAGLKAVVARMMAQQGGADLDAPPPAASYAIVREAASDGTLEVCSTNRFILHNTLQYLKKEYADLALSWAKLAVKKPAFVTPAPVLMRLSDGAVLYSVADFLPELQALKDEHVSRCTSAQEKATRLKAVFKAKIEALVRGLVAPPDST